MLKSFVLYLTTNCSGATRFVHDWQQDKPVWLRNHDDWGRQALESEVYYQSLPEVGKMVIFNHRLCHDVAPYTGDSIRIIIRGDLIYRRKN